MCEVGCLDVDVARWLWLAGCGWLAVNWRVGRLAGRLFGRYVGRQGEVGEPVQGRGRIQGRSVCPGEGQDPGQERAVQGRGRIKGWSVLSRGGAGSRAGVHRQSPSVIQ